MIQKGLIYGETTVNKAKKEEKSNMQIEKIEESMRFVN